MSRRGILAGGTTAALLGSFGCGARRGRAPAPTASPTASLRDAGLAVKARSISPVELTSACLERIERIDARLGSFITVTRERALAAARAAEREIENGHWRGPLHGIPIAVKDNVDAAAVRTTVASALFADRVATADADVIRRLRAAGAILLGKLNMHEFAMGSTSAISHFGPVHNPWNLERVAGGSSGGCGAAVAASLCFGAVGTDTGGSIRIPAACCGIVGLKPTYGVVNTSGTIPVSTSFDHVGPMCRSVADTALMFRAMTAHPAASRFDCERPGSVSRFRVGVLRALALCDGVAIEPEIQLAFDGAMDVVLSPTLPRMPPTIRDATEPFALSACTFAFSIARLPAISVPCGFSSSGLPIGLHIAGPPFADADVLALASAYERATTWHERRPPL